MAVNYTFNNGGNIVDFDDAFIRRDIFTSGGLWLWGLNTNGQLGTNNTTNRSSPVQTVSGGTNWRLISSGDYNTAAIKTDGSLWLWGDNSYGQLGDNTASSKLSPVQTVAAGTNWKQVSVGFTHIAAIKTDGTLWTWGDNTYGQLGDNNATTRYSSPVQTVSGGANWRQVSSGRNYSAAVKTDGTLWLWGYGTSGNLGTGDISNRSSPTQIVSSGTNWKLVACGSYHTAAIKTDGTLWMWGSNNYGELATGNLTAASSPVQTVAAGTNWKQVSCGYLHSAAIKTDGTLWTWGDNTRGHLGTNNVTPQSSPVQTVAGGTNWKQVTAAKWHTAAVKTDGALWLWGQNTEGRLGTNDRTSRSSPVQTVAAGTNWKLVSAGGYVTTAIRTDFY